MAFKDELIAARKKAELSQEQLAKLCGVAVRTISSLEQGINQEPKLQLGKRLEKVLGTSFFDDVYHYSDNPVTLEKSPAHPDIAPAPRSMAEALRVAQAAKVQP